MTQLIDTNGSLVQQPNYRRRALIIAIVASVIVIVMWNIEALEFLMYPLRLFVTYIHEASHSIAAILTGGSVNSFVVSPDGSGVAATAGGIRAIIIPAGYLGAAFFGAMLFFLANRFPQSVKILSIILGVFLIAFTALFARPDETGTPTALLIGTGFGVVLMLIGWKANQLINLLILDILAILTSINAVQAVFGLIRNIDATRGAVHNDAVAFTNQVTPWIPPTVIAVIWAGIALGMLGIAVWYSVLKPLRSEINDTYSAVTKG